MSTFSVRQELLLVQSARRARRLKRLADLALMPLAAPLALALAVPTALLLQIENPGNPFYSQTRIGYHGRTIKVWKLRTMRPDSEWILAAELACKPWRRLEWERYRKLKNDPRVSGPLSALARRLGLDELPQLWNIAKGEMAFIGPRPVTHEELTLYGKCATDYLRFRPGIMSLWLTLGRNSLCLEIRATLDSQYVRQWSPWLDLQIALKTPLAILRSHG